MTTDTKSKTLRLGHSPDPDDAFMWWPLADFKAPDGRQYTPQIDTHGFKFEHVLEDIQSLNERSEKGELEITALSIHQYPYVADKYALTTCGASMGDGYGPVLVASKKIELREFITPQTTPEGEKSDTLSIAVPGERTSAWLQLQLFMLEQEGVQPGSNRAINYVVKPFDQIIQAVKSGQCAAGLLIHEGQLTYEDQGLVCLADMGQWWKQTRKLPLPLGANAIRRDLGQQTMRQVCAVLLASIHHALAHRQEAVEFALQWARGMADDLADKFVGMYVNDVTLDYGEDGRQAVRQLIKEAVDAGIIPDCGEIDFIEPA